MSNTWNRIAARRAKAEASRKEAALRLHESAAAELRGYGIDAPEFQVFNRTGPSSIFGPRYTGAHTGSTIQEGRNKALQRNQREQLRSQNQEIAQLTLQRRRRSSGRQSLLSALPKQRQLGPTGTLG